MNKYNVKDYTDDLNRLIHITKCVWDLYSDKKIENEQVRNQKLQFIIQMENEIYEKLDIANQEKSDDLLQYLDILLLKTSYKPVIVDNIKNRIGNYFFYLTNYLPFASTTKNFFDKQADDIEKINIQACIDYYRNLVFYLTKYLEKSKNKQERKIICKTLNLIRFDNKFIEKIDCSKAKIEGRQKCLSFNHNKDLIDCEYEEFCINTIKDFMNIGLSYTNEDLKTIKDKTEFNITLLHIKIGFSLLENEELMKAISYYKNQLKFQTNCNPRCIAAITEVMEDIVKEKQDNNHKVKEKV